MLYNILSIVRENPGCGSGEVADGLGIDIDVDKILGEYRDRGCITYDDVGGCILNYVNEFTGRHNIRDLDTIDQMADVVAGMIGKRLKYERLIA